MLHSSKELLQIMGVSRHVELGRQGEDAAVEYLRRLGYVVVARNYRNRCGEIDIVARDKDTVCFIEVKTRRQGGICGSASVTGAKQRKLSLVAACFLEENSWQERPARFDVVTAVHAGSGSFSLELIRDAFECIE